GWVAAGDRQRADVEDRRDGGEPSCPAARAIELRHRPDDAGDARSRHRQVPVELFDAAVADLRPGWWRNGAGRAGHYRLAGDDSAARRARPRARSVNWQPAAAPVRHPAGVHRRATRDARPARRVAGADLPRIAEQADVRDTRDSTDANRRAPAAAGVRALAASCFEQT